MIHKYVLNICIIIYLYVKHCKLINNVARVWCAKNRLKAVICVQLARCQGHAGIHLIHLQNLLCFSRSLQNPSPYQNLQWGVQFVNRLNCSQVLESHCMSLPTSQKLPSARGWRILSQDASPGDLKKCYKCSNLRSEIIHLDMTPRGMIWYWIVLHSTIFNNNGDITSCLAKGCLLVIKKW